MLELANIIAEILEREINEDDSSLSSFQMSESFLSQEELLEAGDALVSTDEFSWKNDARIVDDSDPDESYWTVMLYSQKYKRDFTIAMDGELTIFE